MKVLPSVASSLRYAPLAPALPGWSGWHLNRPSSTGNAVSLHPVATKIREALSCKVVSSPDVVYRTTVGTDPRGFSFTAALPSALDCARSMPAPTAAVVSRTSEVGNYPSVGFPLRQWFIPLPGSLVQQRCSQCHRRAPIDCCR